MKKPIMYIIGLPKKAIDSKLTLTDAAILIGITSAIIIGLIAYFNPAALKN